ncbi:hypothetical protein CKAH01_16377 [Colletotrichum kahawae]|uniref:Uncharacterized protein n=1 Tax=Colletotrichum kahawae TaxID=34407 RepID=A0AAD9YEG7_COLKA|nr:hypothetical protein CKAH01_16377 [Colletotrichum kahawae]
MQYYLAIALLAANVAAAARGRPIRVAYEGNVIFGDKTLDSQRQQVHDAIEAAQNPTSDFRCRILPEEAKSDCLLQNTSVTTTDKSRWQIAAAYLLRLEGWEIFKPSATNAAFQSRQSLARFHLGELAEGLESLGWLVSPPEPDSFPSPTDGAESDTVIGSEDGNVVLIVGETEAIKRLKESIGRDFKIIAAGPAERVISQLGGHQPFLPSPRALPAKDARSQCSCSTVVDLKHPALSGAVNEPPEVPEVSPRAEGDMRFKHTAPGWSKVGFWCGGLLDRMPVTSLNGHPMNQADGLLPLKARNLSNLADMGASYSGDELPPPTAM